VKYLNEYIDAGDVKAETLISQMDIKENLHVHLQGIFSRNYSEDLISVTNEKGKENGENRTILELSRDGIFHLLPEGLFFKEEQLKKDSNSNFDFDKEKTKLEEQKKAALLFFSPFDTEFFNLSFELEKNLNAIAEKGNKVFINAFECEPEIDTKNEYISKIKILLPFVSHLRGNLAFLTDILKNILSVEKIEIRTIRPFYMQFIIHKESLSKEEYQAMDKDLADFFVFFRQWFLPVEAEYDYRIKDYKGSFILGNTLLLDYNTHL